MTTTPAPPVPAADADPEPRRAAVAPPSGWRRLLHPDPVVRRLAVMTLVNAFGNGLFMTVGVLFFTRALHFGTVQVGAGLTAAGVCGVLASFPAGQAADRWGSKPVLTVLVLLEGAGMCCYALVHSYPLFVALACLVTAADRGSSAVRNTLYAQAMSKESRVRGRAYLRAVTNVAIGAGASLAALALAADTRQAYLTAILVDAATFAAVAAILPAVPVLAAPGGAADPGAGTEADPAAPAKPLRDLPFLAVTALSSLMMLQFGVIEVGVPLWLVQSTEAPRVLVAPLLLVNTVLVVLFQVRATRGTEKPAAAARAFRRGGLLVAAMCLVTAFAHGRSALVAGLVLLLGAGLQSLGEVLTQAGGWALSYDLADDRAMGAYQGVFNAGSAAAVMIAPVLVTTTALAHGLAGWAFLAALFAAGGCAMGPVVRRAERARR